MSALCIITTPDDIVVATDGGSFRADGTLAGIAGKVILVPEASTIITGRGPRWAFDDLAYVIRNSVARLDFDVILSAAPGFMQQAAERLGDEQLEFCFAGWSECRHSLEAWAVRSFDADDAEALEVVRLPECYAPNEVPPETAETFGLQMPSTGERQWRDGPFKFAALTIAALRFCPSSRTSKDVGSSISVGGFIQMTRLSRHAVMSEIIQEWPDTIGHAIDPEACLRGLHGRALAEAVFGPLGKWRSDHAQ